MPAKTQDWLVESAVEQSKLIGSMWMLKARQLEIRAIADIAAAPGAQELRTKRLLAFVHHSVQQIFSRYC
jgi:hypothetical protein